MKMADIQKKAKALGIKIDKKVKKVELIRSIQTAEGFTPCFNTGVTECPRMECCFHDDCQN